MKIECITLTEEELCEIVKQALFNITVDDNRLTIAPQLEIVAINERTTEFTFGEPERDKC